MSLSVSCPTCQKSVRWEEKNKWRPFCSERCQLIDLGAWANEDYRVASHDIIDEWENIPETQATQPEKGSIQ